MKFSNPLTLPLPKECVRAAKIFRSFVDESNKGLDGVIPRHVLAKAKGFAILTVLKAGAMFSARGGSGIVIAKLEDGTWSAPSAIGIAGLGFGGQFGAEMTDIVIVLNNRSSIRTFMASGSLTLGGSAGLALGPTGRNTQAAGTLNANGVAAMYSYSRSRGFFGGIALEGSVIMERQDTNKSAYNSPVTVRMLLGGTVKRPPWATPIVDVIKECTLPRTMSEYSPDPSVTERTPINPRPRNTILSPSRLARSATSLLQTQRKQQNRISFPPSSWGRETDTGSFFAEVEHPTRSFSSLPSMNETDTSSQLDSSTSAPGFQSSEFDYLNQQNPYTASYMFTPPPPTSSPEKTEKEVIRSHSYSSSLPTFSNVEPVPPPQYHTIEIHSNNNEDDPDDIYIGPATRESSQSAPSNHDATKERASKQQRQNEVQALFEFTALQEGDLSFNAGDTIQIIQRTKNIDDWWKGRTMDGREGIFPANYVAINDI